MRILVLDGYPSGKANELLQLLKKTLAESETVWMPLADTDIAWCRGCFNCWLITPGECCIHDAGNDLARQYMQSDVVILLTPVTFGSYSADLKKALDRLIPNICGLFTQHHGETHHVKRYASYPTLVFLGVQEQVDPEEAKIFRTLVQRNCLNLYPEAWISHIFSEGTASGQELAEVLKQAGVKI